MREETLQDGKIFTEKLVLMKVFPIILLSIKKIIKTGQFNKMILKFSFIKFILIYFLIFGALDFFFGNNILKFLYDKHY